MKMEKKKNQQINYVCGENVLFKTKQNKKARGFINSVISDISRKQ